MDANNFLLRNYNAICKVCSSFIYSRKPELADLLIDICINECIEKILAVAHKYNPKYKESTFVYACCKNVCNNVLRKRGSTEGIYLPDKDIFENESADIIKTINKKEREIPVDYEKLMLNVLKEHDFVIDYFAKTYIKYILTAEKLNMTALWRDKFMIDADGKKIMSYFTFRKKRDKIKNILIEDGELEKILRDRSESYEK